MAVMFSGARTGWLRARPWLRAGRRAHEHLKAISAVITDKIPDATPVPAPAPPPPSPAPHPLPIYQHPFHLHFCLLFTCLPPLSFIHYLTCPQSLSYVPLTGCLPSSPPPISIMLSILINYLSAAFPSLSFCHL